MSDERAVHEKFAQLGLEDADHEAEVEAEGLKLCRKVGDEVSYRRAA